MNAVPAALIPDSTKHGTSAIILMRSVFCCIFIFLLNKSIGFGTSPYLLSFGAITGILLATKLAFSSLKTIGFLIAAGTVYLLSKTIFFLFNFIPFNTPGWFFTPLVYEQHIALTLLFFLASAFMTWLFWRARHALTLEILLLLSVSIELLAGHRNYHFESPRILNNIAWVLGAQQLSVLVIAGAAIIIMLSIYVYAASQPYRHPSSARFKAIERNRGKVDYLTSTAILTIAALTVYLICTQIFNYYRQESLTRTTNGVGLEAKQGVSPLDFHSALGSTNEPGALVRLETDYSGNPFSPMLYLRENALSQIKENQLVVADSSYDQDVSETTPLQPFHADQDDALRYRGQVTQSVFLLADHNLAFALDYPISINPLKNPSPKRFKAAYKAVSLAPSFSLETIRNAEVGDPRWGADTWKHYLEPHADKRYRDIAMKITGEDASAQLSSARPTAAKAFAIVQYLSKNAIYTLTPNHDVKPNEDPVSPFLFGDMRGYCVHFAHATVYMLRSLGIPARIGTGYLTDFSQARDGHILLRMSDRHAWAEVFIEGIGWVPFDTQPEQVESHADTQVDMKLLEELMGILGPDEEILPQDIAKDEPRFDEPERSISLNPSYLLIAILALLAALLMVKIHLRYGWLFTNRPSTQLRRSYIAVCSYLYDLGLRRMPGETRNEFRKRISATINSETLALTAALNHENYAGLPGLDAKLVLDKRQGDFAAFKNMPWKRKLLCALNPASIVAVLTGHKW